MPTASHTTHIPTCCTPAQEPAKFSKIITDLAAADAWATHSVAYVETLTNGDTLKIKTTSTIPDNKLKTQQASGSTARLAAHAAMQEVCDGDETLWTLFDGFRKDIGWAL